jgi:hypothetical protein
MDPAQMDRYVTQLVTLSDELNRVDPGAALLTFRAAVEIAQVPTQCNIRHTLLTWVRGRAVAQSDLDHECGGTHEAEYSQLLAEIDHRLGQVNREASDLVRPAPQR